MILLTLAFALAEDPQPQPAQPPSFHATLPCETCHAQPPEPKATVPEFQLCMACHTHTPHVGATAHLGPLPAGMHEQLKASSLKLTADGEVVCMTCHDPHATDQGNMRLPPEEGELCRACHSSADMDVEEARRSE